MDLNSLPCIADYWSPDEFTGNIGIQKVMTKNRCEEINRYFRLYKVKPILNNFKEQVKEVYHPKQNIPVDEGMIAFKGRLAFRQYMPAKPTKYEIKV